MVLNESKCKSMRISRQESTLPMYTLNGSSLEVVNHYKYLGVIITPTLSWQQQIDAIKNKANKMLGFLRRNFSKAPSSLKLLLYKSLVRPKLEYAAAIWDPCYATLEQSLELVQNNAARFILSNYSRTASASTMKSSLCLPRLSLRRKLFRLSLFHKVYYHPSLSQQLILLPTYRSLRVDHHNKVGYTFCRTNAFYHSFIPNTSTEWNHLPSEIVSISNHSLFCQTLSSFMLCDNPA